MFSLGVHKDNPLLKLPVKNFHFGQQGKNERGGAFKTPAGATQFKGVALPAGTRRLELPPRMINPTKKLITFVLHKAYPF